MATTYLPEYEAFFNELINDEDSDGDCEGFDLEEEGLMNVDQPEMNVVEDGFMRNCVEGDREPSELGFTAQPGLDDGVPIDATASPLEIFNHFITEDDFQTMADEINRYAHEFFEEKAHTLKPNSRFHKWVETTLSEMKVFIAMIVAMGLVVQLDLSEYWTTCDFTSTPFFVCQETGSG